MTGPVSGDLCCLSGDDRTMHGKSYDLLIVSPHLPKVCDYKLDIQDCSGNLSNAITIVRLCNMLRFFTAVKIKNFS